MLSTHAGRVVGRPFGRRDGIGEGIAAVGGAENRPAEPEDAGDVARRDGPRPLRDNEAVKAVFEADALDLRVGCRLDDGANHRVEPRRVAAAGQDANPMHCHMLKV